MIKKETVGETVFIAQTTYRIYRSEEDLQKDKAPFFTGSDEKIYNDFLEAAKKEEWKLLSMEEAKEKYGVRKK